MVQRNPVLLVHGLNDRTRVFTKLTEYLSGLGWSVYSFDLTPNDGSESLAVLAKQLADYVADQFSLSQKFDLVGFSMGGIVTRYYLQRLEGVNRVERYVTISAPNQGTILAYLSNKLGIMEMRPQSSLISDLNRDCSNCLSKIKVTNIWTPWDLMIIPAFSSSLGIGKEIIKPIFFHPWMLEDKLILAEVAKALSEPI